MARWVGPDGPFRPPVHGTTPPPREGGGRRTPPSSRTRKRRRRQPLGDRRHAVSETGVRYGAPSDLGRSPLYGLRTRADRGRRQDRSAEVEGEASGPVGICHHQGCEWNARQRWGSVARVHRGGARELRRPECGGDAGRHLALDHDVLLHTEDVRSRQGDLKLSRRPLARDKPHPERQGAQRKTEIHRARGAPRPHRPRSRSSRRRRRW
jgi:hypothetical protein